MIVYFVRLNSKSMVDFSDKTNAFKVCCPSIKYPESQILIKSPLPIVTGKLTDAPTDLRKLWTG